jgi:esterase/lipase superfamily enzyme
MIDYLTAAILGGGTAGILFILASIFVPYWLGRRHVDEQSAAKQQRLEDAQRDALERQIGAIAASVDTLKTRIEATGANSIDSAALDRTVKALQKVEELQSTDQASRDQLKERLQEINKKLDSLSEAIAKSKDVAPITTFAGRKKNWLTDYELDPGIYGVPDDGSFTDIDLFGNKTGGKAGWLPHQGTTVTSVPGYGDYVLPKQTHISVGGLYGGGGYQTNFPFHRSATGPVVSKAGTPSGASPAATSPTASPSVAPDKDKHIIDLLFATTRKFDDASERFTGERGEQTTFGHAQVRWPEGHLVGHVERPYKLTLLSYTIYEQAEDPAKHFVIRGIDILPEDKWGEIVGAWPSDEALVYVHGFHNTFEDALYRSAQIVRDLRYKGVPVLFSWPSRGRVFDYLYDRESALGARKAFIALLEQLQQQPNIKRVHVLAHSMGNFVVLDALANHRNDLKPLKLGELMMAAPDVDRDHYASIAADVRKIVGGMTLYASSVDKALAASKRAAGNIARAGDVPPGGPIVLPDIESIDVTKIGEEIFGLNHSTAVQKRSVLNDIARLLDGDMRPPHLRLTVEIEGVPLGAEPPRYWQYVA